jgi:hypothetical protein
LLDGAVRVHAVSPGQSLRRTRQCDRLPALVRDRLGEAFGPVSVVQGLRRGELREYRPFPTIFRNRRDPIGNLGYKHCSFGKMNLFTSNGPEHYSIRRFAD